MPGQFINTGNAGNLKLTNSNNSGNLAITFGGGGGGTAGWYFYSDEGTLDAPPPTGSGNAIFTEGLGGYETFDPNQTASQALLYFNANDSAGTSYSAQFFDATQQGSVVTITQGSNVAEYFNGSGFGMDIQSTGPLAGIFIIDTTNCIQTQTAATAFNYNDVITLSFGG